MSVATSLSKLRANAAGCTACPLYARATQTVLRRGPRPRKLAASLAE